MPVQSLCRVYAKLGFAMKDTKKAADFWIGMAVIAISVFFFLEAGKMPTQSRGIGPGDYPRVVCVMLFVLGVVQVARILIVNGFPRVDWKNVQTRFLIRAGVMVAASYLYYKLLKPVGFPVITPIYAWGAMMLFGYKYKIKAAIICVVFSTAVYLLFTNVFMVMLPGGFLF